MSPSRRSLRPIHTEARRSRGVRRPEEAVATKNDANRNGYKQKL
jgi:hypothetical protein